MIPDKDRVPTSARRILSRLMASDYEAYLVGGCVRDVLIGRPLNDWDITTDATPQQVSDIFERVIPTGIDHGTVTVLMDGEPYEVTTYRIDGDYSDGRRPDGVSFTPNLTEDLARRDFTINAMAWCPETDSIVDPFDGQSDLSSRLVQAVGDAHARLSEDGLRAMRAVRFAAVLDFTIEPSLERALADTLENFSKVSVERIAVELRKTLMSHRAAWGVTTLRDTGLLGCFLSSLATLEEDVFDQLAMSLSRAPIDFETRLALLLSPLGEQAGGEVANLRFSKRIRESVSRLIQHRHVPVPPDEDRRGLYSLVRSIGRAHGSRWAEYREALDGNAERWEAFMERCGAAGVDSVPLEPKELAVDGRAIIDALKIKPSKRIGLILEALLEKVWEDPSRNEVNYLMAILSDVAAEVGESS